MLHIITAKILSVSAANESPYYIIYKLFAETILHVGQVPILVII